MKKYDVDFHRMIHVHSHYREGVKYLPFMIKDAEQLRWVTARRLEVRHQDLVLLGVL